MYYIPLPDGTYVSVPDDVPPEKAREDIFKKYPQFAPKGESGFGAAFRAGLQGLKGAGAALAGRTGLMDTEEAQRVVDESEAKAKRIFAPTEQGWTEAPGTKLAELLGGSLPYMAAPLAAGATAAALPVTGPAAAALTLGATGLASMGQFTGTNLQRQMEEGSRLADTKLGAAAAAAAPQAALDIIGFKAIPLVRGLFGSVGKEVTEETAKQIVKQTLRETAKDYAAATGKAMTTEGLTEAGQQLLERLQAGLNIGDPDARREYIDSFIGGAVLGGTLAPAGRFVERSGERSAANRTERDAAARVAAAEQQRTEAEAQKPEALLKLKNDYEAARAKAQEMQAALRAIPRQGLTPDQALERKQRERDLQAFVAETLAPLRTAYAQRAPQIAALENTRQQQLELDAAREQPTAPGVVDNADPWFTRPDELPPTTQEEDSAALTRDRADLAAAQRMLVENQQQMSDAAGKGDFARVAALQQERGRIEQMLGQFKVAGVALPPPPPESKASELARLKTRLTKMAGPGFDPAKAAPLVQRLQALQAQADEPQQLGLDDAIAQTQAQEAADAALERARSKADAAARAEGAKRVPAEASALQRIGDRRDPVLAALAQQIDALKAERTALVQQDPRVLRDMDQQQLAQRIAEYDRRMADLQNAIDNRTASAAQTREREGADAKLVGQLTDNLQQNSPAGVRQQVLTGVGEEPSTLPAGEGAASTPYVSLAEMLQRRDAMRETNDRAGLADVEAQIRARLADTRHRGRLNRLQNLWDKLSPEQRSNAARAIQKIEQDSGIAARPQMDGTVGKAAAQQAGVEGQRGNTAALDTGTRAASQTVRAFDNLARFVSNLRGNDESMDARVRLGLVKKADALQGTVADTALKEVAARRKAAKMPPLTQEEQLRLAMDVRDATRELVTRGARIFRIDERKQVTDPDTGERVDTQAKTLPPAGEKVFFDASFPQAQAVLLQQVRDAVDRFMPAQRQPAKIGPAARVQPLLKQQFGTQERTPEQLQAAAREKAPDTASRQFVDAYERAKSAVNAEDRPSIQAQLERVADGKPVERTPAVQRLFDAASEYEKPQSEEEKVQAGQAELFAPSTARDSARSEASNVERIDRDIADIETQQKSAKGQDVLVLENRKRELVRQRSVSAARRDLAEDDAKALAKERARMRSDEGFIRETAANFQRALNGMEVQELRKEAAEQAERSRAAMAEAAANNARAAEAKTRVEALKKEETKKEAELREKGAEYDSRKKVFEGAQTTLRPVLDKAAALRLAQMRERQEVFDIIDMFRKGYAAAQRAYFSAQLEYLARVAEMNRVGAMTRADKDAFLNALDAEKQKLTQRAGELQQQRIRIERDPPTKVSETGATVTDDTLVAQVVADIEAQQRDIYQMLEALLPDTRKFSQPFTRAFADSTKLAATRAAKAALRKGQAAGALMLRAQTDLNNALAEERQLVARVNASEQYVLGLREGEAAKESLYKLRSDTATAQSAYNNAIAAERQATQALERVRAQEAAMRNAMVERRKQALIAGETDVVPDYAKTLVVKDPTAIAEKLRDLRRTNGMKEAQYANLRQQAEEAVNKGRFDEAEEHRNAMALLSADIEARAQAEYDLIMAAPMTKMTVAEAKAAADVVEAQKRTRDAWRSLMGIEVENGFDAQWRKSLQSAAEKGALPPTLGPLSATPPKVERGTMVKSGQSTAKALMPSARRVVVNRKSRSAQKDVERWREYQKLLSQIGGEYVAKDGTRRKIPEKRLEVIRAAVENMRDEMEAKAATFALQWAAETEAEIAELRRQIDIGKLTETRIQYEKAWQAGDKEKAVELANRILNEEERLSLPAVVQEYNRIQEKLANTQLSAAAREKLETRVAAIKPYVDQVVADRSAPIRVKAQQRLNARGELVTAYNVERKDGASLNPSLPPAPMSDAAKAARESRLKDIREARKRMTARIEEQTKLAKALRGKALDAAKARAISTKQFSLQKRIARAALRGDTARVEALQAETAEVRAELKGAAKQVSEAKSQSDIVRVRKELKDKLALLAKQDSAGAEKEKAELVEALADLRVREQTLNEIADGAVYDDESEMPDISFAFDGKQDPLFSRGHTANPSTQAQVRNELAKHFDIELLDRKVDVYESVAALVESYPHYAGAIPADARGFVDENRAFLVANNIERGNALSVLLHEVGAHIGMAKLYPEKQFGALVNAVELWSQRGDGSIEAKVAETAKRRLIEAETPAADRSHELLAYTVEEAVRAGITPTTTKGPLSRWLAQVVSMARTALQRFLGRPVGQDLNLQALVDMAYGAAQMELRGGLEPRATPQSPAAVEDAPPAAPTRTPINRETASGRKLLELFKRRRLLTRLLGCLQ